MKKLGIAAGTVALFAAALIPAFASDPGNNCSNTTTGPFSTNYCDITNKSYVDVKNISDAQITNNVTATVNTGNNTASYNTLGGSIDTGNATLNATISNVANVNTTTVSGGPTGGNNEGVNEITGPYSDNRIDLYNKQKVEVENSNTATVNNTVNATSDTGNNYADYNTGPGEVRTGDAWLRTTVQNHVNDNATAVSAGAGGGDNIAWNSTTGPFSTDYVDITNKAKVDVDNINDAIVDNYVYARSNTGNNSASYTTLGGDVDTGVAGAAIGLNTEANINTTSVDLDWGGFDNVAGNELTGPFSDNRQDIFNKQRIEVENWNNKCESHNADRINGEGNEKCDPSYLGVWNYDYDVTSTGDNAVDFNTGGGDVDSGWTELWKSVVTHLNDTLTVIH